MSDTCCQAKPRQPLLCPACGGRALAVGRDTLLFHLKAPWRFELVAEGYGHCPHPGCELVYFAGSAERYLAAQLHHPVASKLPEAEEVTLCHCFGISRREAHDPQVRAFVVEQTRLERCRCTTHNPSGQCCLRDFPPLEEG